MNYKGCVMEIRNNSIVVMTDHCTFEEIKLRKSIILGMEIEFSTGDIIQRNRERFKGFVSIAAAILLVVVTSLSLVTYWENNLQSVALLTIDINPSIAIEINEKQQVIKITPLNEEAGLLSSADLKKLHIKEAFDKIIEMAEDEGYIEKNGDNYILITSVKLNNKNKLSFEIDQLVEELIELQEDKRDDLVMIAKEADIHVLEKANREKISVGKMTLYQEVVKEGNEEVLLDDIRTKSVKELLKKEHPVFDQHPASNNSNDDAKEEENKDKREHPVFDQHPGSKNSNDAKEEENKDKKEHPVFDQHPGSKNSNDAKEEENKDKKEHPVFEQHPSSKNTTDNEIEEKKDKKEHPVFDQHPGTTKPNDQDTKEDKGNKKDNTPDSKNKESNNNKPPKNSNP